MSIDVKLGMAVPAMFFALAFSSAPKADCQFKLQDGNRNMHVIYGPTADDERRLPPPNEAGIDVLEDGRWAFSESFLHSTACNELTPAPLRDLYYGQKHSVFMVGTCDVTNTDGENRTIYSWGATWTRIRAPRDKNPDGCYYRVDFYGYE